MLEWTILFSATETGAKAAVKHFTKAGCKMPKVVHLASNTGSQVSATGGEVHAHFTAQHRIRDGQTGHLQGCCWVRCTAVPQPQPYSTGLLSANDIGCSSRGSHSIGNLQIQESICRHSDCTLQRWMNDTNGIGCDSSRGS